MALQAQAHFFAGVLLKKGVFTQCCGETTDKGLICRAPTPRSGQERISRSVGGRLPDSAFADDVAKTHFNVIRQQNDLNTERNL